MIDSVSASGESFPTRVESIGSATAKTTLTLGKPGDLKIPEGLELKGQNAQVNIVRPGGDSISVSEAAKELAQKLKDGKGTASGSTPTPSPQPTLPPAVAPSVPPTTAQGTAVELDTSAGTPALNFTNTAGEKLSLSLNAGEDLHIKEHATGLSVLNKTTGTATQFNFDGTQTALEDTSAFADMSGDDIIVNMTQKSVSTGSGNDIVFNFADNAKISTGAGNDTLIYGQKTAVNVNADMGTGHDRVVGGALQGGSISGSAKNSEGSLQVNVDSASGTTIQSPAPGRLPLPDMGNLRVSGGSLNMGTTQPGSATTGAGQVPQQGTLTVSTGTQLDYQGAPLKISLGNDVINTGNSRLTLSGGSGNNTHADNGINATLGSAGSGATPVDSDAEKPAATPKTDEAAAVADEARPQNTTALKTKTERPASAERQTATTPAVNTAADTDEGNKSARMRMGVKAYAEKAATAETKAAMPQAEAVHAPRAEGNKSIEWRMSQSVMTNAARGLASTDAFGLNAALQGADAGGDKNSLMLDLAGEPGSTAFTDNAVPSAADREAADA